jgi:hypothetical protein
VVTQENWVCDKELYVTNTFVLSRAGDVIGTFVFGQLGDACVIIIIFTIIILFPPHITGHLSMR